MLKITHHLRQPIHVNTAVEQDLLQQEHTKEVHVFFFFFFFKLRFESSVWPSLTSQQEREPDCIGQLMLLKDIGLPSRPRQTFFISPPKRIHANPLRLATLSPATSILLSLVFLLSLYTEWRGQRIFIIYPHQHV